MHVGHASESDCAVDGYCTNESVPVPLAEASLGVLKKSISECGCGQHSHFPGILKETHINCESEL